MQDMHHDTSTSKSRNLKNAAFVKKPCNHFNKIIKAVYHSDLVTTDKQLLLRKILSKAWKLVKICVQTLEVKYIMQTRENRNKLISIVETVMLCALSKSNMICKDIPKKKNILSHKTSILHQRHGSRLKNAFC